MPTITGNGTLFEGEDKLLADVTYVIHIREPKATDRKQLRRVTGQISTFDEPGLFWRLYDYNIKCLLDMADHKYKLIIYLRDGEGTIMAGGNLESY